MKWDDLRKELTSVPKEVQDLHDRFAYAEAQGWLTPEQAYWILFGEDEDE